MARGRRRKARACDVYRELLAQEVPRGRGHVRVRGLYGCTAETSHPAPGYCSCAPLGHTNYLQLLGHHAPHNVANKADVKQHLDMGTGRVGAAGFRCTSGQGCSYLGARGGGGGLSSSLACGPGLPRRLPAAAPAPSYSKRCTCAAQQLNPYALCLVQLTHN